MIDNSSYIIKAIEKKSSQSIAELKAEHKKQLDEIKKAHKKKVKELSEQLDKDYEFKLTQYKKQRENMIAMKESHLELKGKQELYDTLLVAVRKELLKPANVTKLLELVKAKTMLVPKGVKVTGAKAELDSNKLVGVISKDEEIEFDIDAALAQEKLLIEKVEELE